VQKELLGQAHALWLAREHVHGPVYIIFVDTIFDTDLSGIGQMDADGVAFVKEVEDPRRFGIAVVGEDGYITRLVEKPATMEHRLAVIGMYYLKEGGALIDAIKELMARDIRTKGEFYLVDALQIMIDRGARLLPRVVEVWEDCGTPEAVLQTNRYLLEHGEANNGTQARLVNATVVAPSYVAPTAHVENAVVGPYASLADGVRVINAVVCDTIADEGSVIEDVVLVKSLVGRKAHVRSRRLSLNVGDYATVDVG
ncbi:MAG TPA: nucleotidyltransferase, partial [Anaerolineae bacterium]|nr:nucleotidyltransferase [Anaerolineae bacterium]